MNKLLAKLIFIYPTHFMLREWVPIYRPEIKECDYLSNTELQKYQDAKLNRLLSYCYYHDPYYRQLLNRVAGRRIKDGFHNLFKQLPLLSKEDVRIRSKAQAYSYMSSLEHRSTSGSTGLPLEFWKDRFSTAYMEAVQNHAYSWHGIEVGEPQGRFWGVASGSKVRIMRIKYFIKNRIRFSAFDLSDKSKYLFYKRLSKFSPTYLYGYPSLMLEFIRFLKSEKLSLSKIPLKVAIGTGEYVYPHEKEELEQYLNIPFIGEYGCTETGVIAFDCPKGKMHVMSSNILVEVVDSEGRPVNYGIEGEIVVTELHARHFPFIRYRIGDRGSLSNEICPCGRTLPILNISSGRKDDYIITPDGLKVYDAILAYTLKNGVIQFKAVQDRTDHLSIFVVSEANFNSVLEQDYIQRFKLNISEAMQFEFIKVKEIERESSGKLRYFRSEVKGDVK